MKYIFSHILIGIAISLIFFSCSDLQEDIAKPEALKFHGEGDLNPASNNFHGKWLQDDEDNFEECMQCHAGDFSGGTAGVACTDCHPTISVHKKGVRHPVYLAETDADMFDCLSCHGEDFNGGFSSTPCTLCHETIDVHKDGIRNPSSSNFHGVYLMDNDWNLLACQNCHGTDYAGGLVASSCLTCHSQPEGPEACNTCHGNFSEPGQIAPPKDVAGNSDPTVPGVGAHQAHLDSTMTIFANPVSCTECHTVYDDVFVEGHLENSNSDIAWGALATTVTNESSTSNYDSNRDPITPEPVYSDVSCANTYCHGNFKNGNTENVVSWIGGSDEAKCGTCHGDPESGSPLPGGTHFANPSCEFCHADVVAKVGDNYEIIDKAKHINGKLNVFGSEIDY